MTAPIASGWSGCRVGLAPTGKRRLVTAHANNGLMHRSKPLVGASERREQDGSLVVAGESPIDWKNMARAAINKFV